MADLHVTSLCIAPAKAAGSVATQAKKGGGLPFDFSQLFAETVVSTAPAVNAPQEVKKEPEKAEAKEEPATPDVVQLLGLPVPQAPAPEIPQVKSHPVEQIAAIAPEAPKLQPKAAEMPVQKEKDKELPAEPVVAQPLLPQAEPRKEAAAKPAGDELRMLAQVQHSQPAPAQAARPALPVAAPVGTPQWREEFSAAVRVIATEQLQSAEIHLNPPELGPVQVSLRMDKSEASFAFTAPQADTRQALEAALPRLRELLEADGISLGSTSVDSSGAGAFGRDAARDPGREPGSPQAGWRVPAAELAETAAAAPVRSPRLLDVFA